MTSLVALALGDTKVTDVGLECVKGMPNLRTLALRRTQVTSAGVKNLKHLFPNLDVRR